MYLYMDYKSIQRHKNLDYINAAADMAVWKNRLTGTENKPESKLPIYTAIYFLE